MQGKRKSQTKLLKDKIYILTIKNTKFDSRNYQSG